MAWKTGTIKLAAAREIFESVTFEEIKAGGETVGYRANYTTKNIEHVVEHKSLTKLCKFIWREAFTLRVAE